MECSLVVLPLCCCLVGGRRPPTRADGAKRRRRETSLLATHIKLVPRILGNQLFISRTIPHSSLVGGDFGAPNSRLSPGSSHKSQIWILHLIHIGRAHTHWTRFPQVHLKFGSDSSQKSQIWIQFISKISNLEPASPKSRKHCTNLTEISQI